MRLYMIYAIILLYNYINLTVKFKIIYDNYNNFFFVFLFFLNKLYITNIIMIITNSLSKKIYINHCFKKHNQIVLN